LLSPWFKASSTANIILKTNKNPSIYGLLLLCYEMQGAGMIIPFCPFLVFFLSVKMGYFVTAENLILILLCTAGGRFKGLYDKNWIKL